MALIAGLTTPFVMSTLDRIQLQSEAREIAAALRFARSQAITLKTRITFNGDLSNNQYWLTHPKNRESTKVKSVDGAVRMSRYTVDQESVDQGTFSIQFYPMGNSSGGRLRIEPSEIGKQRVYYVITIDPITGTPHLLQEES